MVSKLDVILLDLGERSETLLCVRQRRKETGEKASSWRWDLSFGLRVRFNLLSSVVCQSALGSENNTAQFLSGDDVHRPFFYKFRFCQGHYMRTYNLFFIT